MPPDLLTTLGARAGHFRYESGYHSTLWMDLDALFTRPGATQPYIDRLAQKLAPYRPDGICGPLTGGAFLAQRLAAALDADFYYAERFAPAGGSGALYSIQYRLPAAQVRLVEGKRIAIVDDVISAGSAVRGAFASLQAARAVTVVAGCFLLLGDAAPAYFAPHGITVESVEQRDLRMWQPADCPLCAAGVPLEDPTPGPTG